MNWIITSKTKFILFFPEERPIESVCTVGDASKALGISLIRGIYICYKLILFGQSIGKSLATMTIKGD